MELQYAPIFDTTLAYRVLGGDTIDVVVEMGLGACMGEWLPLARRLADKHTVLLYERAGCGSSKPTARERTPENIAEELHALLSVLPHAPKLTLLAHSQGGLYAQQFARMYPALVRAAVLLDPLSPEDDRFKTELSPAEYKQSGADKGKNLRLPYMLAKLRLGGVIKKIMRTAPPFYYYDGFTAEETDYILDALTKPAFYQTAMQEYALAHDANTLAKLCGGEGFPDIPLCLITHSSDVSVQEIMQFGGAKRETAQKAEALWQSVMKAYLTYSAQSIYRQADHSSHSIHLTDMALVCEAVDEVSQSAEEKL